MVELDVAVSIGVEILEPLVQYLRLCLARNCVITGAKEEGGNVNDVMRLCNYRSKEEGGGCDETV